MQNLKKIYLEITWNCAFETFYHLFNFLSENGLSSTISSLINQDTSSLEDAGQNEAGQIESQQGDTGNIAGGVEGNTLSSLNRLVFRLATIYFYRGFP